MYRIIVFNDSLNNYGIQSPIFLRYIVYKRGRRRHTKDNCKSCSNKDTLTPWLPQQLSEYWPKMTFWFFHIILLICYITLFLDIWYHTYIIGPLDRIINLVSHTTYAVGVNFMQKSQGLQFNVGSVRQIFFEKLFLALLFTLRVFARNLREEIAEEILFKFYFDVWPGARTLALHLISQTLPTRLRRLRFLKQIYKNFSSIVKNYSIQLRKILFSKGKFYFSWAIIKNI